MDKGWSGPPFDPTRLAELLGYEVVEIRHPRYGNAIVRDQKPLIEAKLKGALSGGMTLQEWYQVLNERVFFWLTVERLRILLNAKTYKAGRHDVITVDTARLVRDYEKSIYLAAMNTGNTQPIAHPRGRDTFKTIADYPFADRRKRRLEPAVELTVLEGVRNIERHVIRVERWERGELMAEISL